MRTISSNLQTEIEAGRICRCVRVTQSDATVWGVTQHDKALTFEGTTFQPMPGDWQPPIRSKVGTSVDNQQFAGSWEGVSSAEQDLIDGEYDDATVEAILVG